MNTAMVFTQRKKFGDVKLTIRCDFYIGNNEPYSPRNVLECVLRCPIVKKPLIAKKKLVLSCLYLPL